MTTVRNVGRMPSQQGAGTLRSLLGDGSEPKVVRDSYILVDFPDSEGDTYQAGFSVVYPGCRTGGHSHDDLEEVYHIVRGEGIMSIGDDSFAVCPGDTYVVPRFQHHTFENSKSTPVEYFWIVVKTISESEIEEERNQ